MTRREHKPPTATSSGKSRSVASYATERRSLEHDSDQTNHCHHANKLAMLLATIYEIAATTCTICSHRSHSLRAHAERQMSASAAVARRAWDQKGRAAWHVAGGSPSSGPCAAFEIMMLTGCRCRRAHISVRVWLYGYTECTAIWLYSRHGYMAI